MRIPLDPNLAQLNPLRIGTYLLEIIDDTVIVRDVHTRMFSNHDIRYTRNIRQLARRLNLSDALAQRCCRVAYSLSDELGRNGDSRFVAQRGGRKSVRVVWNAASPDCNQVNGVVLASRLRRKLVAPPAEWAIRYEGPINSSSSHPDLRRASSNAVLFVV